MKAWIKNHLFYVILVLAAAVLLIGYGVWQKVWLYQEIPVIPGNAEGISVQPTGFAVTDADGNIVTGEFDIRIVKYSDSGSTDRYIKLSEEGKQAIIDALKDSKMIVTETPVGRRTGSRHSCSIMFDFIYNIGDITYHRHFYSGDTLDILNTWRSEDDGKKPEKRQDTDHNTRIADAYEARLYSALLEIAEKYKVSETIQ